MPLRCAATPTSPDSLLLQTACASFRATTSESTASMVKVEHKQTHVIVTFIGQVTEQNIIDLVNVVDRLWTEYYYRHIALRIASPGGDVIALEYFIEALDHWKQRNLPVTTRALTSCASAAAIMLSLGDYREASASSILLYHYSRIANLGHHGPITSESAEVISENLKRIDDKMRAKLVDRVLERDSVDWGGKLTKLGEEDRIALRSLRTEWSNRTGERMTDDDDESWFDDWLRTTRAETDRFRLRNRWSVLYDALLDEDKPISATLAVRLGLIDRLVDPTESSFPKGNYSGKLSMARPASAI